MIKDDDAAKKKNYSYKESITTNYLHSISFHSFLSTFIQLVMIAIVLMMMKYI
jgi:hypothetical protein